MKTAIVLGTRPEIIKLSPLIKILNKKSTSVIFTGQHYDYDMSIQFIKQLGINKPNYSMKISKVKPVAQIADIIKKLSPILEKESPDTVIVQGDTNTVFSYSITGTDADLLSVNDNGIISFVEVPDFETKNSYLIRTNRSRIYGRITTTTTITNGSTTKPNVATRSKHTTTDFNNQYGFRS